MGNTDIEVGIYELGYDNVRLFLTKGRSGTFSLNPENKLPCIRLGAEYVKWKDFYNIAIHEAMEFALTRGGHRYVDTQDLSCETGAYVFAFTHAQYSDCCAKAAEFLAEAHKHMKLAWIKFKIEHKIKDNHLVGVP